VKITEVAGKLGYYFYGKIMYVSIFTEKWIGNILGHFLQTHLVTLVFISFKKLGNKMLHFFAAF
jgi:hypothetical protein